MPGESWAASAASFSASASKSVTATSKIFSGFRVSSFIAPTPCAASAQTQVQRGVRVGSSLFRLHPRRFGPGERPGEAQFMAVRVCQVEVTLAPGGIYRGGVGLQSRGHGTGVEGIHIRDVEDD